jgi:hypothetical protein
MSEGRKVAEIVGGDGSLIQATYAAPRITVSFSRKVNLSNYESAEAYVAVQSDVSIDSDDEEKIAAVKSAFLLARASAYEQLGIKFSVDDATVVQERLERVFGPVEVVDEYPNYTDTHAEVELPQPPTAPRSDTAAPKSKKALWQELESNPEKWYDNRANKKNPKGPDFKRKATGEGLWLEYQGKSAVPAGVSVPDPSMFR